MTNAEMMERIAQLEAENARLKEMNTELLKSTNQEMEYVERRTKAAIASSIKPQLQNVEVLATLEASENNFKSAIITLKKIAKQLKRNGIEI